MNDERFHVTTPSDREIKMTRVFDAPRHLVFEALTEPELLKRWFHGPEGWTLVDCEIDLRVDGTYRYMWHGPDGASMAMHGTYREITPPERIVSTEVFDDDWTGGETLSTVVLVEHEGTTTLTNTVLYASKKARDGAIESDMEHGVAAGFDRLAEMLTLISEETS